MLNPFLKVEWLKEGRNVRLPMIIIFYNAILAFITILFMFFNAESLQEGYSYNTSSYLYQFLIISTFQIGMIFVLMPFSVWGFYATDREKHMLEEFAADLHFLECINFCFFVQLLQKRNLGICTEYSNRSDICFRNGFSNGNNTVIFDFSNRSRKSCADRY